MIGAKLSRVAGFILSGIIALPVLSAGLAGQPVVFQKTPRETLERFEPNIIAVLPGESESTILAGAHFDFNDSGHGIIDNWSGAVMLPTLYPTGRYSSAYSVRAYTAMEAHNYGIIRRALAREGYAAVLNDEYRLPDKLAAIRAGLGRYGKNSVVLTEAFGSCIMFATIVTDAPLEPAGKILEGDPCGSCDLCLRACPTHAFPAPYRIDRKLCITNWLWGLPAPRDLREKQENRLFGCGDCVGMCPKNRKLEPRRSYPVPIEDVPDRPELIPLAGAAPDSFRRTFPAFPLRAGIDVLRGNVVIALGNTADEAGIEPLRETLRHPKPQIRAYSAWALGRIGGVKARGVLGEAKPAESESAVLEEIDLALSP